MDNYNLARIEALRNTAVKPALSYEEFYYHFYHRYAQIQDQGTFNERFTIRLWDDIVNSADDMIAGNKVTVSAAAGIAVENATEDIYVYNAAGSLIDVKNGGNVTFALPQGSYVVKVGNDSFKVSVTR